MDCSALLNVQQQDFCRRLKIGNLLISPKNDLHSESCIFFEEAMETIHQQSLTETQQFVESNVLDIDEQDFLDLLIYRNVAIESFLSQFGDLVWLDNVDHNHSKFPLDHSSFRAKSNTSIKILLKHYYGDLENIKLLLSSQECETYHFVVFNLLLQEKNINQPQFRTIFLGFLPIKLISKKDLHDGIKVNELLYINGLNYYLQNECSTNQSLSISAKKYLKEGNYHQAVYLFEQLIAEGKVTEEDFFLRGVCQYKLGNEEIAIRDFSKAIQLNDSYLKAYHWLGFVYQKLEKYPEALNLYNQEIKLDSLNFFAYIQRASVKTKLSQLIDALEDYTIASKINNQFFQVYYNRAYLYYQLGDLQTAIEDYKKAIKIKPNLYQAYYNLAIIYQEYGNCQKAIKRYQLAIEINPKYIQAYYNLAILQSNLGLYKRAMNNYQKILEIAPNFIQANYNKNSLSLLLNNQGHIVLDSTEFISSLEQTPEIISIDDREQISEEDQEKYSTLSGDRTTDNRNLNS